MIIFFETWEFLFVLYHAPYKLCQQKNYGLVSYGSDRIIMCHNKFEEEKTWVLFVMSHDTPGEKLC